MGLEAAGGRCGAVGLLAELHQGLVVLLLLLLLLLVARQDEEETQDALQVAIPDLCRDKTEGKRGLALCCDATSLSFGFISHPYIITLQSKAWHTLKDFFKIL